MRNWLGQKLASFGRYIAGEATTTRRDPGTVIKTSDADLTDHKRRRVIAGAQDLQRNFSIAAWAIRKHLDYVATFGFQANSPDAGFNRELERLVAWRSRAANLDVTGRHNLGRFLRLAEAARVVAGDVVLVKFNNGQLQAIEGDRIRTPSDLTKYGTDRVIHGFRVAPTGRIKSVSVHRRLSDGRYEFERDVAATNFLHLGYFDTFDQIRGVSPLASAIAPLQDQAEVMDYARAKSKVTQLFALAITRQMADSDDEDGQSDEYEVDFGKGPVKLELDPGDKAEFLESRHPSTEFQAFGVLCLQLALKALDIPWSFVDESFTNYSGQRTAHIQYQQSCKAKREDLIELLDRLTGWWLNQWIAEGVISLPRGVASVGDLNWQWVPAGVPWFNPEQEIQADVLAIENKIRTRSEIRKERYGDDWRDVVLKLREEEDFLRENGFNPQPAEAPANADQ